jgi:hydroxyacylglutathione hydrolase
MTQASLRTFYDGSYRILGRPVGPFAMNQYLVVAGADAVLIDAGAPPEPFARAANALDAELREIWLTHAHVDHVAGLAETKRQHDVPIRLHDAGIPVLSQAVATGLMFGMQVEPPPPPDLSIVDEQRLTVGGIAFVALHTPGHAPGHIAFYDADHGQLLVGDLLFRGSIGRLDLPGCDTDAMRQSLARILTLPDDVVVYPGHMEPTTIGEERRSNPFLREFGLT